MKERVDMKLAEALQERADLNRNIEQLKVRLRNNAIIQENEPSAEDPAELLRELDSSLDRLEELMSRINHTNCTVRVGDKTITDLIAKRDTLSIRLYAYRELAAAASETGRRARMTEIKLISTVNVKEIQKRIDSMSKEYRLIDNAIQAANWSTELL